MNVLPNISKPKLKSKKVSVEYGKSILITCSGGPAAVGVIKSLIATNYNGKIVTLDCDSLSSGFHLTNRDEFGKKRWSGTNKSYVVPLSVDDSYWDEVLKIIKKEKVDLILPTGDSDMIHFSKNEKILNESYGGTI